MLRVKLPFQYISNQHKNIAYHCACRCPTSTSTDFWLQREIRFFYNLFGYYRLQIIFLDQTPCFKMSDKTLYISWHLWVLTFLMLKMEYSSFRDQYHACWCHSSWSRQGISRHGIYSIGYATTRVGNLVFSVERNHRYDMKCEYICFTLFSAC